MTQTRTFLILAWLMVATLLWMEWGKERDAAAAPAPAIPTATQVVGTATPRVPVANVPGAARLSRRRWPPPRCRSCACATMSWRLNSTAATSPVPSC
jgi:YidC/Oxa1 family membrane protein insertase